MADKNSVSDWDTTPDNNDNIAGIPLAENQMRVRDVNNALRNMMAQLKTAIGGAVSSFADNVFRITDNADATKQLAFEVSGITTGTTRTVTAPNASGTMVLDTATQTLTGKTLTTPVLTLNQSTTPTPTAEGDIRWDTDDDVIAIGDGAATRLFLPIPASTAAGDIEYFTAAKVKARLAKATDGNVLTLASGLPSWAAPAGGSQVLLATITPSGSPATATSANFVSTPYTSLNIVFDALTFTGAGTLTINISSDNGSTFDTAVALGSTNVVATNGIIQIARVGITAAKIINGSVSSAASGASAPNRFATKTSPTTNIRLAATSLTGGSVYVYGVP